MVSEISIPPNIIYIVKIFIILGLIFFPIIIFLGLYYYLSAFINQKIMTLLLNKLNNNPLMSKYMFIVSIIVKFLIFFGLLKLILQTLISYLFFNFEDPNDLNYKMVKMSNRFATVFSIIFFVIYELILFPFNLIIFFDNKFINIFKYLQKIINMLKKNKTEKTNVRLDNLNNSLEVLIQDWNNQNINKDIKNILNKAIVGMANGVESYPMKFLNKITGNNKQLSLDDEIEVNKNIIASNISGRITVPIIYLGIIYLGLYYLFNGSMFVIRIIIFILILIITILFIYPTLVISIIIKGFVGFISSIKELNSSKNNSLAKIINDFSILKLDIKDILLAVFELVKSKKN